MSPEFQALAHLVPSWQHCLGGAAWLEEVCRWGTHLGACGPILHPPSSLSSALDYG